ncbi:MAG: S8 family serine peptidase, partial [Propionibacteriales bacterium]|nr:S8 family serine peptidase [Propionibacteriales bacterium]
MRTMILSRLAALSRRRRALAVLLTAVLAATLGGPLPSATGGPAQGPTEAPITATGQPTGQHVGQQTGKTYQVTLLTGDVVVLHDAGDGKQAAWVQDDPRAPEKAPAQVYQQDGEVHVVPAAAVPYVASGVLDDKLFNISLLVEQGYHDAARKSLPLLLTAPGGPSAKSLPRVPSGVRKVRDLASIGTVSVSAAKSRMESVWTSLRGTAAARTTSTNARLAGAAKVWLNAKVQSTLDESVPLVGAPEAWDAGYDGDGVPVAVLDTGYDATHADLAGRVTAARNFSEDEDPPGATAVDGNGHGTHVAATVAGSGAASDGARKGVAPGADLLIGKVLDDSGSGFTDQIIAGMEWAVAEGAEVVSMSLGTPWASDGTDPMSQAVDRLTESSGALFVIAAGNAGPSEETVGSPGAATAALTVGATTKQDDAAWFSSRGPRVGDLAIKPEIVAPGAGIVAARAAGTSLGSLVDDDYTSLNGTSMATPHVAGAAAIVAQQHPDWDAEQIKARLVSSSTGLPDEPVTFQGAGRLDVAAAVDESVAVDHGTLSLGRIPNAADTVTRTLTYTNPSDRAVTLRLSTDVRGTG